MELLRRTTQGVGTAPTTADIPIQGGVIILKGI
jgi:hypothetical protein